MYRMETLFLPCTHLPQRLKPQTAGAGAAFYFSLLKTACIQAVFFLQKPLYVIQFNKKYVYSLISVLFRAKNLIKIGLLALFILPFSCNTNIEEPAYD